MARPSGDDGDPTAEQRPPGAFDDRDELADDGQPTDRTDRDTATVEGDVRGKRPEKIGKDLETLNFFDNQISAIDYRSKMNELQHKQLRADFNVLQSQTTQILDKLGGLKEAIGGIGHAMYPNNPGVRSNRRLSQYMDEYPPDDQPDDQPRRQSGDQSGEHQQAEAEIYNHQPRRHSQVYEERRQSRVDDEPRQGEPENRSRSGRRTRAGHPDDDDFSSSDDSSDRGSRSSRGRRHHAPRRHDSRDPPDDRARREDTYQTNASFGSGLSRSDRLKIKHEDIGSFDPDYSDPEDQGMVFLGTKVIFTDVQQFQDRIQTFLEDRETREEAERQIIGVWTTLLRGAAARWWTSEVEMTERQRMRKEGLDVLLDAAKQRFGGDSAAATAKFNKQRLSLSDFLRDENALSHFIQKMLRFSRVNKTLNANNSNWEGIMQSIYFKMDRRIHTYLPAPDVANTFGAYMDIVGKKRSVLVTYAKDEYPNGTSRDTQQDSRGGSRSFNNFNRYENRRGDRRNDRDDRRDDRRDNRRGDRRDYRDDGRRGDRRDYRDDGRRGDNRRDNNFRRNDRDKGPFRGNDKDRRGDRRVQFNTNYQIEELPTVKEEEGEHSDRSRFPASDLEDARDYPSDADSVYFIGQSKTCGQCGKKCHTKKSQANHIAHSRCQRSVEGASEIQPIKDDSRLKCRTCLVSFASRNKLFAHLRKGGCEPGEEEPIHTVTETLVYSQDQIEEETTPEITQEALMGGFSHMRVQVRATPNEDPEEICIDSGTGRDLVSRKFLKNFEHTIRQEDGGAIQGFDGPSSRLSEVATFAFFMEGIRGDGSKGLVKFWASAWIVEKLDARALLGNPWLTPRQAKIDYHDSTILFPNAAQGFVVPFMATKPAKPVIRKVVMTNTVKLAPGETRDVPVNYVNLPGGRSFMMTATHAAACNALLSHTSPKMCVLVNPSNKEIRIPRNTRIGTIHECTDNAYFVTSPANVIKTLALATALGANCSTDDSQRDAILGTQYPSTVPLAPAPFADGTASVHSMGGEFYLTTQLAATALGNPEKAVQDSPALDDNLRSGTSSTPYSDAIYNAIVDGNPPPQSSPFDVPDKPYVKEKNSTFGIKTPEDAPAILTRDGVHVYAKDPGQARILQRICDAAAKVWQDSGPIQMREEDQMRIELVEGWQNMKLNTRMYPLPKKDRDFVDKTHDGLHKQGRMKWGKGPTPFAHPVFVVWRTVHGEEKGRVVVDLRALNKAAMPDCYPLPLQSDVIESVRGKRFLTIIDATQFFFQFLVRPSDRGKLTIISHRGLEEPTVALMGYRNAPSHAQRFMDKTLKPHRSYCRAFIDDIIVFSDTFEDHCRHLKAVFDLFIEQGVSLSPKKSFIGYPSIELLGFYVDAFGLSTTESRIEAFKKMEMPTTLKALETYLGATGFLRTMIPYYAQVAEPLQERKTALLAEGRKTGRIGGESNPNKRLAFTRSAKFEPSTEEALSFAALQKVICDHLRLSHMNPDKVLFLQIDGSLERGFGVMVFHLKDGMEWSAPDPIPATHIEPVMFLSRCLNRPELNYGPSELEVACLVWACKRLRTILHSSNHRIVVLTDHEATKGIVNRTSLNTTSTDRANRRLVNASIYLSAYPLDVYHLPGRLNLVPDALSRLRAQGDDDQRKVEAIPQLDDLWDMDDMVLFIAEAKMTDEMRQKFMDGYRNDTVFNSIIEGLCQAPSNGRKPSVRKVNEVVVDASKPGHQFRLVDGLLYNRDNDHQERLVIPRCLIQDFLQDVHDDNHHFGRDKMMADLERVHFRKKRHLVDLYVKHCHQCGMNRQDNQLPVGNYTPIQAPSEPMHTITIDFVTAMPKVSSEGTPWSHSGFDSYNALMTVTDKTSKRSLLIPGHERYSASDWGQLLGRHLLLGDWSCPKVIISDRDGKFTSDFWTALWRTFNTRLMMTTAYHPQSDGQSEKKNQVVELAIRHHAYSHPDEPWVNLIPSLQWNLNNAHSAPIDTSPHEFLFGFKIPSPSDRLTENVPKEIADIRFMREHLRRDAQLAMDIAAAYAKKNYDAKHRQMEFDVGDRVWLSLGKAYQMKNQLSKRESQRREGPFKIKRKVTPLAYELDLPEDVGIHPVISVQYLTPYNCDDDPFQRVVPPPGPLELEYGSSSDSEREGDVYEVGRVMNHRNNQRTKKRQYLIRWKGYGQRYDQWMDVEDLNHSQKLIDAYHRRLDEAKALQGKKSVDHQPKRRGRPPKATIAAPTSDPSTAAPAPGPAPTEEIDNGDRRRSERLKKKED